MLRLAVHMVGYRISALIAVACAVLGGAALITGTGVLAESGLRSHLPAGRLGGADVVVAADQEYHPAGDLPIALPERRTVPARLVGELAGLPDVTAAVGDLGFPAALVDAHGRVVPAGDPQAAGHGWSSTQLLAAARIRGHAPSGSGEIAVASATAAAAGVKVGDRVQVVVNARPAAGYRISAVVDATGAGILFADTTAVRLSGRGDRVDLIGLRTAPGAAERVAAEVRTKLNGTGLGAVTGGSRGDLVSPGAGASRSLLILLAGSLAGVILLITGFVMASALAVAVAGQRRDLALMRAVGATPKQIRRLAAAQSTVVAAVALIPGVALGYLLAGQFLRLLADLGVVPAELPLTISPLPAVATVLLTAVAVQLSARGATWRTSRMPATEAVAASRSEPRNPSRIRTRGGLLVIAAATTMSAVPLFSRTVIGATATSIAGILAAIGLSLAGPALVRGIGDTAARLTRSGASAPTWLAMSNVRAYALRNAGIVSALAMAVLFVLTYTLTQTTLLAATADDTRTGTLAQQRLSAPGLGGLPAGTLAAVRRTPGVRAAAPVSTTTVVWPYQQFGDTEAESGSAMILTPDASDVLDLDVRHGSLGRLTGDTIAVSSDVARSRGAEPGQRVRLVLGDGARVDAKVVAVYARGLGFGTIVLSHDLAAGHTTTGLDQSILIRTDGTDTAGRGLTALAASRPGLTLENTNAGSVGGLKHASPEVWINLATIVVLLVYLLLSIANKLVAATAQRRVELGALRLNGTTPRQIRAMMRREAAVTAATALTTALLLSALPLALLGQGFLGRPWPAGPAWLLPALALTVTATAFLTIELPTRQALRTPPADVIRTL
ncbi:ABC transporter permease [Streptantibioticus ferralitis]|uniref:FtsX-like permease family protein n=1 Tax=Streptantibioticus ferralitis TaxID=236510 RepID=A0ABT5Z0W8_9ACTN|nr:FtsX-like permease family protein [Streptantibioticus ferralitis]MDF2257413.1 FtsX-like permease family protein [Streptantibioticus ferralitis]